MPFETAHLVRMLMCRTADVFLLSQSGTLIETTRCYKLLSSCSNTNYWSWQSYASHFLLFHSLAQQRLSSNPAHAAIRDSLLLHPFLATTAFHAWSVVTDSRCVHRGPIGLTNLANRTNGESYSLTVLLATPSNQCSLHLRRCQKVISKHATNKDRAA